MSFKIRKYILGIYDLILAFGAFDLGIKMIRKVGMFSDFPVEWLSITPFENWVLPGMIGMVIYGLGNLVAAVFCLVSSSSKSWSISAIMGGVLLVSMRMQILILGESFLATGQLIILAFIQICLSIFTANSCKKNAHKDI